MYDINLVSYGELSPVPTMQLILKTCFAFNNWEKLFSLALEGIFRHLTLFINWCIPLFEICRIYSSWTFNLNEVSLLPIGQLNVETWIKYPQGYWTLVLQWSILYLSRHYWILELQWSILALNETIECYNFNEVLLLPTKLLNAKNLMKYHCLPQGYCMMELKRSIIVSYEDIECWNF